MNHRAVLIFMAVALVFIAIAARWEVAQRAQRLSQSQAKGLVFQIKPLKEKLLLGEPLKVQIQLSNNTDKEIEGFFELSFIGNRIKVDLSSDGGQTSQPYISPLMKHRATVFMPPSPPVKIPSQKALSEFEFISFNTEIQDFAFPKAGRFWVRMNLGVTLLSQGQRQRQQLESDWVMIDVVDPSQEQDKKALQFIIDKQLKPFLTPEAPYALDLAQDKNEAVKQLQQFLKQFPASTYVPYVAAGLAAICQGREQELPACAGQ